MAEPYRFGGPLPERAKQLMDRRRFRGSESFANLKRLRGDWFDEARAATAAAARPAASPAA